jgi:hypothetical protein
MEKEIIKSIESEYPLPIASVFRKVRTIDSDDIINKHDSFGDLFEIITKFLAVVILQDFKQNCGLPQYLDDFLKKMLHPSLGHWNEIIRTISSEDTSKCTIASQISKFYKTKVSNEIKHDTELLQSILSSKIIIKTYKEIFDLLILYRNKVKGHGAKTSKDEYKDRTSLIERIIGNILIELSFIKDYIVFYVDEINVLPTSEFKHKVKICTGAQFEPGQIVQANSLLPNHTYIKKEEKDNFILIDLHPLLTFSNCKDCKTEQVFVFNDYRKDHLEYLSYGCGHFNYPDMLPNEFEKFFKISLSKIVEEDKSVNLSDEEQVEKASKELTIGLEKITSKEYFEALEYLQISASYKITWEANYYSALTLMVVNGSPSEILFHLNSCQQLEPENYLSNYLKDSFNSIFTDETAIKEPTKDQISKLNILAKEILEENVFVPNVRPIYYYLCPKIFRKYSQLFWVITIAGIFIMRGFIEQFVFKTPNVVVLVLKAGMIIDIVLINYVIANFMKEMYFALLQQLIPKAKESFQEWYQNQLDKTFGVFNENSNFFSTLNLRNDKNKEYLTLVIILLPIAVLGSIYLTCYDYSDLIQIAFQSGDFIVIWAIIVPGGPVLIKSFMMLKKYAKLPLKPVMSSVSSASLNRVGKMIFLVSIPYTLEYLMFTMIGYLMFSKGIIVIQLALFYFMVSLGCIWTLVTPLYFSKALLKAKEKVISKYSEHIEEAFKILLNNPNNDNLERYHWLKKQQKEFLSLKTLTLTPWTLIGVLCVNILILSTALWYPFIKWDISLSSVLLWFKNIIVH